MRTKCSSVFVIFAGFSALLIRAYTIFLFVDKAAASKIKTEGQHIVKYEWCLFAY